MAFLGRVVKWETRGDYYVLKATDVLGRMLAVCFVWPRLIDEEAEAPRAYVTCPKSPCWSAAKPELDLFSSRHMAVSI